MAGVHDVMIRKLKEHTALSRKDEAALRALPVQLRNAGPSEDLVRQGDRPNVSLVVLKGMVARYHTLPSGARQYLSFHIAGDWPDAQALFVNKMDHSVAAINDATLGMIPHTSLIALFERVPSVGFAIWRETLIDAAIFREAITNNSGRDVPRRLAHFFCEQYYRAQAAQLLLRDNSCPLELSQEQIGEALGASLTTINRAMQAVRRKGIVEFRAGRLHVRDWARLAEFGQFDPGYLHLRRSRRGTKS